MSAGVRVVVVRADQSPANAKRWNLELACGHSVWVTANSEPKRATCQECVRRPS